MKQKEIIKVISANGEPYTYEVPRIVIVDKFINDTALKWIFDNTGLNFEKQGCGGYEAEPATAAQIVALFCTYNFTTCYQGDLEDKLYLKFHYE
ncbi:hypothetical protein [Bacteroides fragilis]|uniref:hypothetical protein n=1 Tax=Bacteroides fragilis TaxID=817 RepID=UPI00321C059C